MCRLIHLSHSAASPDPRVAYTLEVLMEPGAGEALPIAYGVPAKEIDHTPQIYIIPSGFFDSAYGTMASLPSVPLSCIEGVPLLFGVPSVEMRGNSLVVKADLIASAYFLLTRYEEWIRRDVRDKHGRFPGRESLPFRGGFLHRPLVDEYAELLRKWARLAGLELPTPKRHFSVLLTHDVDTLGPERGLLPAMRSLAAGLVGRRPVRAALADFASNLGLNADACDNLNDVLKMDGQLIGQFPSDCCRALYFFLAGGHSIHDGAYRLSEAWICKRLRTVIASGADIGLHASYEAGAKPHQIADELCRLQTITGLPIYKNRHHFLRWREPEDGSSIANAGVRWDATLGYADTAGYRLGVCRPIPLFDPARQCLQGIEEHPLLVMDRTLDRSCYMNLGEDDAFEYLVTLAEETFRHKGEFVCLWHNDALASTDMSYHRKLYPRLIRHLGRLLNRDAPPPEQHE